MTDPYPDIREAKVTVVGVQGSGKTEHAKEIIRRHNYTVLVYAPDPGDWKDMGDNVIIYKYKNFNEEIEDFMAYVKKFGEKKQIDGAVVDEFDMVFHGNSDINSRPNTNDIVLNHRHYGVFVIGITRRPQDIPTKYFESCLYNFFFTIDAPNIKKKLNDVYAGMGDLVGRIPYKSYGYVMRKLGEPPVLCNITPDKLASEKQVPYVVAKSSPKQQNLPPKEEENNVSPSRKQPKVNRI